MMGAMNVDVKSLIEEGAALGLAIPTVRERIDKFMGV